MGIITRLIRYGAVFAVGFYLGSGCAYKQPNYHTKLSNLEKEVTKYEQKIDKIQQTGTMLFP